MHGDGWGRRRDVKRPSLLVVAWSYLSVKTNARALSPQSHNFFSPTYSVELEFELVRHPVLSAAYGQFLYDILKKSAASR